MSEERKSAFEKLFGRKEAEDVREGLKEGEKELDEKGLERKERTFTWKEVGLMDAAQVITEAILERLDKEGITLAAAESEEAEGVDSPEDVTEIVAEAAMEAIEELADEVPEEKQEESEEEADDEEEDESKADDEEEEEEAEKSFEVVVKSLTDAIADMLEDQGEMAQGMAAIAQVIPAVKEIGERLEKLEGAYGKRPRQASKADETVFEDDEIEEEASKSIDDDVELFMGRIPVKADPYAAES